MLNMSVEYRTHASLFSYSPPTLVFTDVDLEFYASYVLVKTSQLLQQSGTNSDMAPTTAAVAAQQKNLIGIWCTVKDTASHMGGRVRPRVAQSLAR